MVVIEVVDRRILVLTLGYPEVARFVCSDIGRLFTARGIERGKRSSTTDNGRDVIDARLAVAIHECDVVAGLRELRETPCGIRTIVEPNGVGRISHIHQLELVAEGTSQRCIDFCTALEDRDVAYTELQTSLVAGCLRDNAWKVSAGGPAIVLVNADSPGSRDVDVPTIIRVESEHRRLLVCQRCLPPRVRILGIDEGLGRSDAIERRTFARRDAE